MPTRRAGWAAFNAVSEILLGSARIAICNSGDDPLFFHATMIKGGTMSSDRGVMVTRIPIAFQKLGRFRKKALLKLTEMKCVVISYEGGIFFRNKSG
jgi:hypothetical protein